MKGNYNFYGSPYHIYTRASQDKTKELLSLLDHILLTKENTIKNEKQDT